MWPALRKGSGWSHSQSTLSTIGTRGGKKNYVSGDYDDDDDDDDDYDDDDDDDDNDNVSSSISKVLKQGWHQRKPINYDNDDKIDDNDDDDDDDDDDGDDNNDGNGVFFFVNIFL